MRLTAKLDGQTHQIDFEHVDTGIIANIDDRRYEVTMRETGPGTYLFISAGRVYECRVEPSRAKRESLRVNVGHQPYAVTLFDPKRLGAVQGAGLQAGRGAAEIVAPMPGKLVRLLVEVGARVEAGDGIVIVEAMKMQNELKSPCSGTVAEIRAACGETVNSGDILAVIEPRAEG